MLKFELCIESTLLYSLKRKYSLIYLYTDFVDDSGQYIYLYVLSLVDKLSEIVVSALQLCFKCNVLLPLEE